MNQASLKLYKIRNTDTGFQGSSQTINKEILAILSKNRHKQKPAPNLSTSDDFDIDTKKQVKLPPFTRHFKQTSDPDSPKYKVDERNFCNGGTYHFCV